MSVQGHSEQEIVGTTLVSPSQSAGPVAAGPPELAFDGASGGGDSFRRALSLGMILRARWTVVLVFLVLSGGGLAAVWTLLEPQYRAEAVLQVRSQIPRLISRTEETGPIPQYQQYLQSQVAIIENTRVLERVLDRSDVQQTWWYRRPPSPLDQALSRVRTPLMRLRDALEARAIPGTELIEVGVVAGGPRDAQTLANAVLSEYLSFVNQRFSREDKQRIDALNQERQSLMAEKSFLSRKLSDARSDLRTASPGQLMAQRRLRLDELESELAQLNLDIAVLEEQVALQEDAAASQPSEGAVTGDMQYEEDDQWRRLRDELRTAEHEHKQLAQRFGPRSDVIVNAQASVELARKKLRERETQLDKFLAMGFTPVAHSNDNVDASTSPLALQRKLRLLNVRKGHLEQYVKQLRNTFEGEFVAAEALQTDAEKLDETKGRLALVERRLNELDEKRQLPASIYPIAEAGAPSEPFRDRRIKFSLAVLAGALLAGAGLAYLRVAYSPQVQDAGEVARDAQSAFLGHLPLQRGKDTRAIEQCPIHAEQIRMIRTALLSRLNGQGTPVVQVTSATVGSGKSTLSTLLARSLAQLGKRVLLVDTDVRRPSLADRFAIARTPGLINLLAQGGGGEAYIHPTGVPGLNVVPAGKAAQHGDFELLANGVFAGQIDRWRREYDLILLDSAPLLGTADAAILARHADGTVVVVRQQHCRREALLEALSVLSVTGGKLLGTVFVGAGTNGGYGYGYGYGHQYDVPSLSVRDVDPARGAGTREREAQS